MIRFSNVIHCTDTKDQISYNQKQLKNTDIKTTERSGNEETNTK